MKLKLKGDLLKLPLQKRLQALEETRKCGNLRNMLKFADCELSSLFVWGDSRQGHEYWSRVRLSIN